MAEPAREDRIRGALLGGVVGDAFGSPLEGAPQTGLRPLVDRRVRSSEPWGYTDDATMIFAVAEALSAGATIDPMQLLERFAAHYEPARGFGRGMKLAIAAFTSGVPWTDCAYSAWPGGSGGNGAAVRIVPIASVRWRTPLDLADAVYVASRVTHAHPDAIAMAQVQASALTLIVETPTIADSRAGFRDTMERLLPALSEQAADRLAKVFSLVDREASSSEAVASLGTSTFAIESAAAALWSFLTEHGSFESSIAHAASLGGDVDSICSMVGALAGAYHGDSAVPQQWVDNLAHETPSPATLRALADVLATLEPSAPHEAAQQGVAADNRRRSAAPRPPSGACS